MVSLSTPSSLLVVCYMLLALTIRSVVMADNGSPVDPQAVSGWPVTFEFSQFERNTTLKTASGKKIFLFWSVDDSRNEIKFGVASNNGGWVGIGVSQSGGMKGASIFVGRKHDDNVKLHYKTYFNIHS